MATGNETPRIRSTELTDPLLQAFKERQRLAADSGILSDDIDSYGERLSLILENFAYSLKHATPLQVSGRITQLHKFGGLLFVTLTQDDSAIELKFDKRTDPDRFVVWKKVLRLGDIVRIAGLPVLSKRKAPQIEVSKVELLALCALPQSLSGSEENNPQDWSTKGFHRRMLSDSAEVIRLKKRSGVLRAIRDALNAEGFHEQITPVLNLSFFGGRSRPFTTYSRAKERELYLRVTSEIALKTYIAGGALRLYEIGPSFRNESEGAQYLPGYTALESYAAYTNLDEMLEITSRLLQRVVFSFQGGSGVRSQLPTIQEVSTSTDPIPRLSVETILRQKLGIDLETNSGISQLAGVCKKRHPETSAETAHLIHYYLKKHIYPDVVEPTFITDLPAGLSPFIASDPVRHKLLHRVFLVANGLKLAEIFQSQTDPILLLDALEQQAPSWKDEYRRNYTDFLDAAFCGFPPISVLSMGIERLFMFLAGEEDIRNIYPTL